MTQFIKSILEIRLLKDGL